MKNINTELNYRGLNRKQMMVQLQECCNIELEHYIKPKILGVHVRQLWIQLDWQLEMQVLTELQQS
jgi:hypothetical protein